MTTKADLKNIKVTREHFMLALDEVLPAFGVEEEDLKSCLRGDFFNWGPEFAHIYRACPRFALPGAQDC